jgi:selenide,water dikinase
MDLLGDVLAGARRVADEGGWLVVGGHTVDGPEPLYGQAVLGEADPDRLLTNTGGSAGEALVLTKAIGTGLLATAVKRSPRAAVEAGGELEAAYAAAVSSMIRLNAEASRVALATGARAATDVTGFGLLGHLHKLALASGVAAELDVAAVPRLPGAEELLAGGFVPGGTGRNLAFVREHLLVGPDGPKPPLDLLADPQTSGGLLFACRADRADEAVAELRSSGHPATRVGGLVPGTPGRIHLR